MKKYVIIAAYGLMFLLFLFRLFYYREELADVSDEELHISYLAYMQENPYQWIPEYENMRLCEAGQQLEEGIYRYTVSESICGLGYPPLYYRLMQLVGGVITDSTSDGHHVYIDLKRLKTANLYLTALVMIGILYIGYMSLGRLTQSVIWHGVYAAAATSVTMLVQCGSAITNDNLACLGVTLFMMGILRYCEKKKNCLTYVLTAAGFYLSAMSRVAVGGIALFLLLVLVAAEMVKYKKSDFVCNRYFLMTLPVYLLTAVYYIVLLVRYGSLQPGLSEISAREQAVRSVMGYLPFAALALTAGLQWLVSSQSYRVWHFLGYKARARRMQRKRKQRRLETTGMSMVLPCVLGLLLVLGGAGFEVLSGAPENVYDSIRKVSLERQKKQQGYEVMYVDSGEGINDRETVGYLLDGLSLIQDFTVTEEMLAYKELAVGIEAGTYGRKNTVSLYVELYQDEGFGKAYRIDCSRLKNNEDIRIAFGTAGMTAGICHVKIYSDAASGNDAVTVYTTGNCVLAPDIQVAGGRKARNLVMNIYTPYGAEAVKGTSEAEAPRQAGTAE